LTISSGQIFYFAKVQYNQISSVKECLKTDIITTQENEVTPMKVTIRRVRMSDATRMRELLNDEEISKEITTAYPYSLEQSKKDISHALDNWGKKAYTFAILADGEVVGQIVLENPSRGNKTFALGYFVGSEYQSKGIATQAVKRIVKFGFEELKLKKIWGDNDSDNPASGRVMEKAGFKLEGKLESHIFKNGTYVDVLIWGKINQNL